MKKFYQKYKITIPYDDLLKIFLQLKKTIKFASLLVGAIAQLVEQWTENPCVPSSNLGSTTFKNPYNLTIVGVSFY